MHKLLQLYLLLITSIIFANEGSISGKVQDISDPLHGANVFLVGTSMGSTTDSSGSNRTRYTLASRFKHLLGEDFEDTNGNGVWDSTETFTDCAITGADVGQGNGMYNGPIEPGEIVRLPLSVSAMTPGQSYSRYFQMKYPFANSPVSIIDWKENHLILAELALRGESVNVTAIDAINDVRSSYGLQSLANVDYEVLLHERDKELFCQGQRLIDQNRFSDVINWHLPDGDTWHYLPVPFEEVLNNPNYP